MFSESGCAFAGMEVVHAKCTVLTARKQLQALRIGVKSKHLHYISVCFKVVSAVSARNVPHANTPVGRSGGNESTGRIVVHTQYGHIVALNRADAFLGLYVPMPQQERA